MSASEKNMIDELFRKNLAQAQMEPKADWTAMEQMLDGADRLKKGGAWFFMSIAASVLLLISAGLMLWFYTPQQEENQLAQDASMPTKTEVTPKASIENQQQEQSESIYITAADLPKTTQNKRTIVSSGKQQRQSGTMQKKKEIVEPISQHFSETEALAVNAQNQWATLHTQASADLNANNDTAIAPALAAEQDFMPIDQQTPYSEVEAEAQEYPKVYIRPAIDMSAQKKNAIQRLFNRVNHTINQAQALTSDSSRNELKMEMNRRIVAFVNR